MTTPPGPPGPPARRGGITRWVRAHRGLTAAAGGVVVVAAVVIVKRSKSSGAAAASTAATPSVYNPGTDPGMYGYGGGTYGGYAGDMSGLQSGLSGGTVAGLPTSTTAGVDSSTGSADATSAATGGTTGPAPGGSAPASAPKSTAAKAIAAVKQIWVPAQTITVAKNQTLLSLSQQYLGTTNRTALAHANNLGTGAGLRTGQKLVVPGHNKSA